MVCLSPTWVLLLNRQVLETVIPIQRKTKEDLIVHKYVGISLLSWIQWLHIALYDGNSSFGCSCHEVVVNLQNGSVSLALLSHSVAWEVLHDLVLFVPVSDALRVQTVQRCYSLIDLGLLTGGVLGLLVKPVIPLERGIGQ